MFKQAIEFAQVTQTSQTAWATTYLNLGTCHRKLGCVLTSFLLLSHRTFSLTTFLLDG